MAQEDDARAESAAIIAELKEQIQKSEAEAEQYRKQLGVLAMKLDEVVTEQTKSEDHAHEKDSIINLLRDEIRELSRQLREMDQTHETERAAMLKEKEAHTSREEELQTTIQRLKETIAQKDLRMNVDTDRSMSRSRKSL
jgi:chromosome segregation ATPase